jgi:hypothetical protein
LVLQLKFAHAKFVNGIGNGTPENLLHYEARQSPFILKSESYFAKHMVKEEARVGVIVAAVFVALCLLALLVYLAFWRVSDYFIVIYSQFSILMTISSPFPDSFKKK